MIEDNLFFDDQHHPAWFHKQKLWLHRTSMKRYQSQLVKAGHVVNYIENADQMDALDAAFDVARSTGSGPTEIVACDPTDFLLEKRLKRKCHHEGWDLNLLSNPNFINTADQNREYRKTKKRWFMADFYKHQRRRMGVLMEGDEPAGGKWSFDSENRKKVPKSLLGEIPRIGNLATDEIDEAAKSYVLEHFPDNPGNLKRLIYPTTHAAAKKWLEDFLQQRFELFGIYEDAIVEGESWLWHSVLTPMLNIGLLSPQQIVDRAVEFANSQDVPINSLEGFVRQIIGWREFMRATYEDLGVTMRNSNHWEHHRKVPNTFYDATTGIGPIDDTISRILDTGYCHHIERLMVLGGFMFLCEFHPKEIYRWFMEMFVDSYDWVMVPNVYAMSQHADGGLITTKPYFSGSSYVRKMSNHKKGDWCEIWDGLYWRWIWNHVDELGKNPRWAMMCSMARKMDKAKMDAHLKNAEGFLAKL